MNMSFKNKVTRNLHSKKLKPLYQNFIKPLSTHGPFNTKFSFRWKVSFLINLSPAAVSSHFSSLKKKLMSFV